jgi:hypothetical protein
VGLLGEHSNDFLGVLLVFAQNRFEFLGQIQQVIWVHNSAAVQLTVAEDIAATDELLIEHHDHLVLGASNDGSAQGKGHILAQGTVDVHDAVAHLETPGYLRIERRGPVWESLGEHME